MLAFVVNERAVGIDLLEFVMPPDIATSAKGNLVVGPAEDDDLLNRCLASQCQIDIVFERNDRPTAVAAIGGDKASCPAVSDTIAYTFGAESPENNRVNRSDTGTGQHGYGGLGNEWHVDDNPVTFFHLVAFEYVGEEADLSLELAIS